MSNVWSSGRQKFWLWAGAALLLVSMLVGLGARSAFAGSVTIKDDANILSSSDENALRSDVSSLGYNVIFVTTAGNPNQLTNRAASEINSVGSRGVVLALDTAGQTAVQSRGLNLSPSQESSIAQAARSNFQSRNWRSGFESMLNATNQYARVSSGSASTSTSNRSSGGGFPFFGCLVIGLIALVAISFFGFGRRRTINNTMMGRGPNYGPGYGPNYGPGYGGYGPGYGPGYNQGGIGPLGGGAIGAGLGGLVGYELGKEAGRHEGGYYNNPGSFGGDNSSWSGNDNVVGTDSWGSSGGSDSWGSSGGSSDWGGGGGSLDAGGGGDWGGGGDSGGGGGSDSW
jgi:hypothetical protein